MADDPRQRKFLHGATIQRGIQLWACVGRRLVRKTPWKIQALRCFRVDDLSPHRKTRHALRTTTAWIKPNLGDVLGSRRPAEARTPPSPCTWHRECGGWQSPAARRHLLLVVGCCVSLAHGNHSWPPSADEPVISFHGSPL